MQEKIQLIEKFADPGYLEHGNQRQKEAYGALMRSGVFSLPAEFAPVLAGTVPIGIDVAGSDLDIVCRVNDPDAFRAVMKEFFGAKEGFSLGWSASKNAILCRFVESGMIIEIFGADGDPLRSNAFRHMLVEDRILRLAGERFREDVIALKEAGIKTEPAFAKLLGLDGDPFEELLEMENMTDAELREVIFMSRN